MPRVWALEYIPLVYDLPILAANFLIRTRFAKTPETLKNRKKHGKTSLTCA